MRFEHRPANALRPLELIVGAAKYAEGSCLVKCGDTHVLCTATVEERIPPFLKNTGKGWVTAEYGMLPRCSPQRIDREAAKGKQSGRTQEIQRLIGRALRAVVDEKLLGERQIRIDCDVIMADGGTRTASITGGYVALHLACQKLVQAGTLKAMPLREQVAAVSCGITEHGALLDLDYSEDSTAHADANFVFTASGQVVEIQASAEGATFSRDAFNNMYVLAEKGIADIVTLQKQVLGL